MDAKMIRIIDSNYNELFTIPDGGSIVVTRPNGEQYVGVCKYLDETHFEVNGLCYHACQFAEIQERNGSKMEPEKEPEMVSSYRITHRIPVGDKVYVMGHSPTAPQPYATWQAYRDYPGKDWGHYWSNGPDARADLQCRAEAERMGIPYDHTKKHKQKPCLRDRCSDGTRPPPSRGIMTKTAIPARRSRKRMSRKGNNRRRFLVIG